MPHEEYLRRNLLIAKAEGAKAAVSVALKRLEMQARPPRWLVKSLNDALVRIEPLPQDLAMWRDMSLDAPDFVRAGKETLPVLDGHGHVTPRSDGFKARCGGPKMCAVCAREEMAKAAAEQRAKQQF